MIVADDRSKAYFYRGSFKECSEILRKIGGFWVTVWREATALAANLVFGEAYGAGSSSGSISVTTAEALLNITGGQEPYTIVWSRVGSGSPSWTINNGDTASPSFTCSSVGPGAIQQANFEADVTDALGANVTSATLTATAENYGGYA